MRPGRTSRAVRGSGRPTARLRSPPPPQSMDQPKDKPRDQVKSKACTTTRSPWTSQRTNPETRSRAKRALRPDRYSTLKVIRAHLLIPTRIPDPNPHDHNCPPATWTPAASGQGNHRSRPGWRTWWTMCARSPRATALVPRSGVRGRYGTPHQVARTPVDRSRGVAILRGLLEAWSGSWHSWPGWVSRCAPSGLRLAAPVRCPAPRRHRIGADGQGPLGGYEPSGSDRVKPLGELRSLKPHRAVVIGGQVPHQARHLPGPP